jgi:hypothetical protein
MLPPMNGETRRLTKIPTSYAYFCPERPDMPILSWIRSLFVSALISGGWFLMALGQTPANRIVRPVNESDLVTLTGNMHPMAWPEFDQGPVSAETQLDHLVLYLASSAEQQSDLDALVTAQHEPGSPLYQKRLTPAQYGSRFGVSAPDVQGPQNRCHEFDLYCFSPKRALRDLL